MIATLNGIVSEKLAGLVIVEVGEVGGVGYGVLTTAEDYGRLKVREPVKLYIHEHIRENSHDLFGFITIDTKTLFEQLLEVNGVGPKMALNMLSIGSGSDVRAAIAGGDVKFLQSATGVGKRVAERVVVELKDKVGLLGSDVSGLLQSDESLIKDEAVEALVALGYTPQDAAKALSSVDKKLTTTDRIKQALKVSK